MYILHAGLKIAQAVSTEDSCRRVQLFGTIRASNVRASDVDTISVPRGGRILPFAADEKLRFPAPTYEPAAPKSDTASPKKRQKLDRADLEAKWATARTEAVHCYKQNEIPSVEFLNSVCDLPPYGGAPLEKSVSKPKIPKLRAASLEPWIPPDSDDSLQIPGEQILAREKKTSKHYWPARILAYIPPPNPSKLPLYKVQWIDQTEGFVERANFYSMEEDGFGTCPLGVFESAYEDVVNDTDEPDAPKKPRGPSPEPLDPPPSLEVFRELSVRNQFVYTKPVLQAILRDEYSPAREMHRGYIAGGASQNSVVKNASLRGMMNPRDVEEFKDCLEEWCLRDAAKVVVQEQEAEQSEVNVEEVAIETQISGDGVVGEEDGTANRESAEVRIVSDAIDGAVVGEDVGIESPESNQALTILDSDASASPRTVVESSVDAQEPVPLADPDVGDVFDTASVLSEASDVSVLVSAQKPPRQTGCEAYEDLSTFEKHDYCLNVLLPELLIQINAWRAGKRTSMALLSDDEEETIHQFGVEELHQTDWVFDVKRLRARKETELKNKAMKETELRNKEMGTKRHSTRSLRR
ncbi:hypothetical protein DFH06DRAFT_969699 [Mycena polygramma]|nr:hypothetical protein DFH06DRAFT_969699 [Mycena polygramma]